VGTAPVRIDNSFSGSDTFLKLSCAKECCVSEVEGMRVFLAIVFLYAMVIQVAAVYRLQPGDTLSVSVWQDSKIDRNVVIEPDGRISFPLAGHLQAAGKSTEQLEEALRLRLQDNYKESLDVTVMLIRRPLALADQGQTVRENDVFVTGEVKKAGKYIVTRPTTVLQAISLAGGLDVYAAKRRIAIQRRVNGEDVLIPFDYRAAVNGRDPWSNLYLRDGDVVIVPERGLFKGLF
jgi:polysaccharide export outer membrane protein